MVFRLIKKPEKSCDTKMNKGATPTAVSFYLKVAEMTREALAAELN